ncbi:MAG: hypothetical protein KZQ60_01315 [Candidatus Thiodiazotropha sp. (ex Lucinoma aequizonata)]|nr:hypothetical protein [Candidatus Thiodiazotropha sp. (ex Lucinoma aequizonata)]MCU7909425.1 hypothetical protein [Candidatus Thiodiazotropha sp. (ex Lucinoma aequizonata)]
MPSAALLSRFATTDTCPEPYAYRGLSYPPRAPLFHGGQREIKNSLGAGKTQCITSQFRTCRRFDWSHWY